MYIYIHIYKYIYIYIHMYYILAMQEPTTVLHHVCIFISRVSKIGRDEPPGHGNTINPLG